MVLALLDLPLGLEDQAILAANYGEIVPVSAVHPIIIGHVGDIYLSDPLLQDSAGGIIVIDLLLEALEERTVYSFRSGIGETCTKFRSNVLNIPKSSLRWRPSRGSPDLLIYLSVCFLSPVSSLPLLHGDCRGQ